MIDWGMENPVHVMVKLPYMVSSQHALMLFIMLLLLYSLIRMCLCYVIANLLSLLSKFDFACCHVVGSQNNWFMDPGLFTCCVSIYAYRSKPNYSLI